MTSPPTLTSTASDLRFRKILVVVGIFTTLVFWKTFFKDSGSNRFVDFDNVDADEEEDFATTSRSAINTVKLPYIENPTPKVNASMPSLILHVGPVRTGVKEIHSELLKLQDEFLDDKYVLASPKEESGTIDVSALHEGCQRELSLMRQSYERKRKRHKKTLKQTLAQDVPCWKSFLDSMETLKSQGQSLVVSDDQLSKQILEIFDLGSAVLDWTSIRATLQTDFNIVIVASYRRYYDWLPAAKAAAEQVHLIQHSSSPPRLARWPDRDHGMLLEPLFPHFVRNAVTKLDVAYTPRIVELYEPYVSSVKILNLYAEGQSVRSTFVCDVLEEATAACAASLQRDSTEDVKLDTILNTKVDDNWSDFQLFDELVTTAMSHNFIRFKHIKRVLATETTEYYVKTHLKMRARELPLTCPNGAQLNKFLAESTTYESSLLPEEQVDLQSHTADFNAVGDRFCRLNMRAVLRQRTWRAFFRHLTNTSATRIQAGGRPGIPGGRYLRG